MKNLLLIFAKEPKEGLVKTRLAKDIGSKMAKELYEAFLKDIMNNIFCDGLYETKILCTPESSILKLKTLLGFDNIDYQKGNGLTQRLGTAFKDSFLSGYEKVAAIGTDTPLIDSGVIRTCFDKLDAHDCVIGPASDGGYYLIGLRRQGGEIFEGISWSTKKVFSQTLDKLKKTGYSYFVTEEMSDVDELEDIIALKKYYAALTKEKKERTFNTHDFFKKNEFEA
jgi:rSAM/selenodomain-associated transferase 1